MLDGTEEDVCERLRALTNGRGQDRCIDVARAEAKAATPHRRPGDGPADPALLPCRMRAFPNASVALPAVCERSFGGTDAVGAAGLVGDQGHRDGRRVGQGQAPHDRRRHPRPRPAPGNRAGGGGDRDRVRRIVAPSVSPGPGVVAPQLRSLARRVHPRLGEHGGVSRGAAQPMSGRRDTEDRTGRYGGDDGALEHELGRQPTGGRSGDGRHTNGVAARERSASTTRTWRAARTSPARGGPGPKRAWVAPAHGPSMNAVQRAPEQGCGALASANVLGEAFGNSGFRPLLPTL